MDGLLGQVIWLQFNIFHLIIWITNRIAKVLLTIKLYYENFQRNILNPLINWLWNIRSKFIATRNKKNLLWWSRVETTWDGGINKKHKLSHSELIKQLICLLLPFQCWHPLFLQMSLIKWIEGWEKGPIVKSTQPNEIL